MEERRLVWRVARHWSEITHGGRLPSRGEIDPCVLGEDWKNCLVIAVRSPIERSRFITVGVNLTIALCPTDTLAGVLVSRLSRVVSARRGAVIDGEATVGDVGILYRAVLLPLSEDGVVIDHVLGAANFRRLHPDEAQTTQVTSRTQWL